MIQSRQADQCASIWRRRKRLILCHTRQKRIFLTDPASTWTAAAWPAIFAYSTNYLIDLKAGVIVDGEASAVNKIAEVEATKIMIDRVEEMFAIKPQRLVGDTNYGVAAILGWLVD